jgi:hypothetical protein
MKGTRNVVLLRLLVAAAQQQDENTPALHVVHPIPGTDINTQFGDAFANRFHVAGVSVSQAANPDLNPRTRSKITEAVNPSCKFRGLLQFDHPLTVAYWLLFINPASSQAVSCCFFYWL